MEVKEEGWKLPEKPRRRRSRGKNRPVSEDSDDEQLDLSVGKKKRGVSDGGRVCDKEASEEIPKDNKEAIEETPTDNKQRDDNLSGEATKYKKQREGCTDTYLTKSYPDFFISGVARFLHYREVSKI